MDLKIYTKYNWDKLKKEYFQSNKLSVSGFLLTRYTSINGHMYKMTTGWYKEKKEYEQEQQNKLNERNMQKQVSRVARQIYLSEARHA